MDNKNNVMAEIKRIDINEFRDRGYLQEANRRFFHPLGLALEIVVDDNTGKASLGGVWDYRDDPEGMMFGIDTEEIEGMNKKAQNVDLEMLAHQEARVKLFGDVIQPIKE